MVVSNIGLKCINFAFLILTKPGFSTYTSLRKNCGLFRKSRTPWGRHYMIFRNISLEWNTIPVVVKCCPVNSNFDFFFLWDSQYVCLLWILLIYRICYTALVIKMKRIYYYVYFISKQNTANFRDRTVF